MNDIIKTILIAAVVIVGVSLFSNWLDKPQEQSVTGTPSPAANIISSTTEAWIIPSNWTTSSDFGYSVNNEYTTTTVYAYKRSIYRPTSTASIAMWTAATSTAGTPSKLMDDSYGNRRYGRIEWISGAKFDIFLSYSTSSDMLFGRGILISSATDPYVIDSDNLYQGPVWGMAYATSFDPAAAAHPEGYAGITEAK